MAVVTVFEEHELGPEDRHLSLDKVLHARVEDYAVEALIGPGGSSGLARCLAPLLLGRFFDGTGSWMADMMKGIMVFVSIQAVTAPNKKRAQHNTKSAGPVRFQSASIAPGPVLFKYVLQAHKCVQVLVKCMERMYVSWLRLSTAR